ncbi:hypothetical protein AMTRI_Chr04g185690 [Amborella trichopoda]|uniref:Uncharacterized protein n=1 Tax=Amborella trichopoda TaxID=13333 RepID=W1NQL4_AMBTC|nr:uncharacterized protein LOC18425053 [Amborella trichopoda]ERM97104.1 hypothetical protein AMTR_s00126p00039410 [Amborella trichopoda]|eukprot:XP_006829688.1 uncharacterized protein LOC18425053 [Amborella trichopoda]
MGRGVIDPRSLTPEALMAEIDAAIAASEYQRATAYLKMAAPKSNSKSKQSAQLHDVKAADEAYKSACSAIASGQLEPALASLRIALAKCPPDKTSALAKIHSLMSITSLQLHDRNKEVIDA